MKKIPFIFYVYCLWQRVDSDLSQVDKLKNSGVSQCTPAACTPPPSTALSPTPPRRGHETTGGHETSCLEPQPPQCHRSRQPDTMVLTYNYDNSRPGKGSRIIIHTYLSVAFLGCLAWILEQNSLRTEPKPRPSCWGFKSTRLICYLFF